MQIALLSETYPPDVGGLAVSAERLARLLAANHSVTVFAPSRERHPGALTTPDGVRVRRFSAHRRADETLAAWFDALAAAHAARPFDLLHGYFLTQAGFLAAYAGRYLGCPSVASARGNDLDRAIFDSGKAAHVLFALQQAGAITANSRDLVRKAQALAPGQSVTLVPNGVDAARFTAGPRDEQLARQLRLEGLAVLGFVGEARAKKGLAPLLLAFRAVAQRRSVGLLLLGGARDGPDQETLDLFCRQNPALRLAVVPHAPHEDAPGYYRLIDVLLLPSIRDGLPNALLEGMACERAVVGADVGGLPDALRHDENGLLVPPGDASALADAIETLLDNPALRLRLGRSARATVLRDFTQEQELADNLAVYARLLAGS
jgi:glycosyltransferase involved in cell wall biosynthesis